MRNLYADTSVFNVQHVHVKQLSGSGPLESLSLYEETFETYSTKVSIFM